MEQLKRGDLVELKRHLMGIVAIIDRNLEVSPQQRYFATHQGEQAQQESVASRS